MRYARGAAEIQILKKGKRTRPAFNWTLSSEPSLCHFLMQDMADVADVADVASDEFDVSLDFGCGLSKKNL